MSIRQALIISYRPGVAVTPGSSTFDTGAGNFTVPTYNTLTVEIWGGGASGTGDVSTLGNAGGTTSCSTLSMTAGGGNPGASSAAGGTGGAASGGTTTNTAGNTGGNSGSVASSGSGAGAPNGGATATTPTGGTKTSGTTGTVPGGGGSGANIGGTIVSGGGSGSYSRSDYSAGAIAVGALLAYSVGAAGTAPVITLKGGDGATGRVKFTWS